MDRYDEALAKARAGKSLEEIFPEMKESEDERMRKAALEGIEYLERDCGWDVIGDIDILDVKEYLEKQKEAELTEEDKKIIPEALVMLCDDIINHRVHTPIRTNEEGARKIKAFLKTINRQPHKSKEEWERQKEQPTNEEMLRTLRAEYEKGVADTIAKYEQKEQPKEELVYRLNGIMQEYIKEGKDEAEKEHRFKCYQLFWDALENTSYFEQKPAEYAADVVEEAEEYASKVACGEYGVEVTEAYIAGVLSERNRGTEWSEDIIRKAVKEVGLTQHQIDWFKTNVFPPKQKWNENDRKMLNRILLYFNAPFHDMNEKEKLCFNWRQSLPERFNLGPKQEWSEVEFEFRGEKVKVKRPFFRDDKGRGYSTTKQDEDVAWYALRAWCEKKGVSLYDLYPIEEWSEEDERKRKGLIKGLEDRMGFGWASDPFSREEYIAWLKSLRPPQYCENCKLKLSVENWKPSKEQMEALNALNCHGDLSYVGQQGHLISLYNDLKKLM